MLIQGVSHHYGKITAVTEITLDLPTGALIGLIGPDGVGKSTLLGLVAGAKKLQRGDIRVLGGSIGDTRHRRRVCQRIAYMPQGLGKNLYAELSVRENLDFFARLFGQDTAARNQRIGHLLKATGLAPFPDRPVGKLSGGMKQKLGLCCALIHNPDLLILDEPTTGVDPLSRRQFWALIGAIRAARPGLSVIVSTAYMDEASDFDWLVAMDGGRVIRTGPPAEFVRETGAADLEEAYRAIRLGTANPIKIEKPPLPSDSRGTVIQADGLTRKFGDFVAVDNVSFAIEQGEIFGFLGSNGCGKSTTMKMLTGLLPASSGEAFLFGNLVDPYDREAHRTIGYMSQAFSLYGELTVRQNLSMHARIFGLSPEQRALRMQDLVERFDLGTYLDKRAESLPLGMRQRLSLAVAVIHQPAILILDEPTSGVDPDARSAFWELLIGLSRDEGVTVFLSTHFMAEAEWCDRVSLMHEGQVLACDTPEKLKADVGADTLEEAFIAKLRERIPDTPVTQLNLSEDVVKKTTGQGQSLTRLAAYARRETIEVLRDPVRLAFSFFGSVILMVIFCFGISLDVEDLDFAVLDYSSTPESRAYVAVIEGSRYFNMTDPLAGPSEGRQRLLDGNVSLTIELPPGFGQSIRSEDPVEILATVDAAMPFKGETVEGYIEGLHATYLAQQALDEAGTVTSLAQIETRFRYNQNFDSIAAMAPAMPALLLILLPSIITAVSIARERELGSITNFYVTPTTRLEFMVGKQLPYAVIAFVNFLFLAAMTDWIFGVPLKGSFLPLMLGAALYVWAATSFGLVISTLTSSQVAAVFATTLSSIIPTIQFSGLLQPVSTLEGAAQVIGSLWPASYFLNLNVGAFTKGLGFEGLLPDLLALAAFGPAFTLIAVLSLRAQER